MNWITRILREKHRAWNIIHSNSTNCCILHRCDCLYTGRLVRGYFTWRAKTVLDSSCYIHRFDRHMKRTETELEHIFNADHGNRIRSWECKMSFFTKLRNVLILSIGTGNRNNDRVLFHLNVLLQTNLWTIKAFNTVSLVSKETSLFKLMFQHLSIQ